MPGLDDLRQAAAEHADALAVADHTYAVEHLKLQRVESGRERTAVLGDLTRAGDRLVELREHDKLGPAILAVDPVAAIDGLEDAVPIALLPVRLETRFQKVGAGGRRPRRGAAWRLLVRIYPDVVHHDQHRPALTEIERANGTKYWAHPSADEAAAWAELVAVHGPERAAWIRRSTAPGAVDPGPAAGSFTRGPRTNVLPDRFWCIAQRGGVEVARVVGNPVRDPLALGPDPTAAPDTDGLDPSSRWLVDFAAAEQAGMALTLDLGPDGAQGVDHLMVYGVKSSLAPAVAAGRLGSLFDAHHFTDGLGFLTAGTPTNNTAADRSGWASTDVRTAERSHRVEIDASGAIAQPGAHGMALAEVARAASTDGARVAGALGVDVGHLAAIEGAGATGELDARAMVVAMWPAIGGYGIKQFLSKSITAGVEDALRNHATAWVRSRGPFPTLRVGRQPYGILPVTSLAKHRPRATDPADIEGMYGALQLLAGAWRLVRAPRMGVGDPADTLARILGNSPVSVGYRMRREADAQVLELLGQLADVSANDVATIRAVHQRLVSAGLGTIKLSGDGLETLIAFDSPTPLGRPIVQAEPLSATAPLIPNYLTFLRTAKPNDILEDHTHLAGPLLYLLARLSVLSQYLDDGLRLTQLGPSLEELIDRYVIVDIAGPGRGPFDVLRDLVVTPLPVDPRDPVGIGPVVAIDDVFDVLRERLGDDPFVLDGFGGKRTIIDRNGRNVWPPLEGDRPATAGGTGGRPDFGVVPPGFVVGGIGSVPAAAETGTGHVAEAGAPMFIAGTVTNTVTLRGNTIRFPDSAVRQDLGAVDVLAALAHLESKPTAELDRLLRETLDLGGHRLDAWVTSLATQRLAQLRADAPSGIHLGAYGWVHDLRPTTTGASAGYVHAPSAGHAATASVLRSAHLARGSGDELAIDLSSSRVRVARRVLDGVRAGQSTGALLGTVFEEHLMSNGGHAGLGPCRQAAPLAGSQGPGAVPGALDGESLLQALEQQRTSAAQLAAASELPAGAARTALATALSSAIDALTDAADAVGDLLLAESVHQLVSHNLPRATAALAATSGGPPLDDYGVVHIAPPAVGLSHRAVVLHRGRVPAAKLGTRGRLDPFLDAWLTELIGPLAKVAVSARLADGSTLDVSVADLGLSGADVVALSVIAPAPAADGSPPPEPPPLLRLLIGEVGCRAADRGTIVDDVSVSATSSALAIAATLAATMATARSFDPGDVPTAGGSIAVTADLADLRDRLTDAVTWSTSVVASAEGHLVAVAGGLPTTPAELHRLLVGLVSAGLTSEAVPAGGGAHPGDAVDLTDQLRRAAATLRQRADLARADLSAAAVLPDGPEALTRLRVVAEQLLGGRSLITVGVSSPMLDGAVDNPPAIDQDVTVGRRRQAARRFLNEMAGIREPLAHVRRLRQFVQATRGRAPAVDLVQLSATSPKRDPWSGLGDSARLAAGDPAVAGGRISMLRLDAGLGDTPGADVRGVVIDEWSEAVPTDALASAVSIHANRPSNEAPQAILVAVPPDQAIGWNQEVLESILSETFELASMRAIDLPRLQTLGPVLPMLHVPLAGRSFNKNLRWRDVIRP